MLPSAVAADGAVRTQEIPRIMQKVNLMPRHKTLDSNKPSAKTLTKVEFILALPTDMPAREAVAKAEAAGFTLTQQRVHAIRWAAKHAVKKGGPTAKAAPVARAVTVKAKPAKGAAAKTKLAVMAPAPARAAKATVKPRATAKPALPSTVPGAAWGESTEERFLRLVLDLGLARATALIGKIHEHVSALALA